MFVKFPKIHRLGKEETEGILNGLVVVQEKIDGANTSIWIEDGEIKCGSRTRELVDEAFNGFVDYVKSHPGIIQYLNEYPNHRLYGEWLVRHTISYNETAYKKFYLFDIRFEDGSWADQSDVSLVAANYSLEYPQIFAKIENPTEEQLMQYVGKTNLGTKGEGIVLKNLGFVNKFGDHAYAKIVTQAFKEENALVFSGNNKHSETYWEMYIVNKYCTLGRVQKIMNKIQPELNEPLGFQHVPKVANTCFYDMITEEIWEIQNKVEYVNFRDLKRLCLKKFTTIYKDILNEITDRVVYA